MSDLISREVVIDVLKQTGIIQDNDLGHLVIDEINRIPTAFDAEKVVAELEEMIKPKQFYFCKYAKGGCKYIDDDKKDCMECIVEYAIDIVGKGGVE